MFYYFNSSFFTINSQSTFVLLLQPFAAVQAQERGPRAARFTDLREILIKARKDSHSSLVQLPGLSMRCPSLSNLKSSSTGMPGYGEPPKVKISHISTPNDQLRTQKTIAMRYIYSKQQQPNHGIQ